MESRIYRFGPFELDAASRRLARGGKRLTLARRPTDLLLHLVANAGRPITKQELNEAVWGRAAVTDNCLVQAVSLARRRIDPQPDRTSYIQTLSGDGYQFAAAVIPPEDAPDVFIGARLDPFGPFLNGRAALESFDAAAIAHTRQGFAATLAVDRRNAAAHVGLANALILTFESTRADEKQDLAALAGAVQHALKGCELDLLSADAWGALAVARHCAGDASEAIKAARKAVALEPREWRHQLRLAYVSWGVDRLRAAERVIARCPEVAVAYWLAATVFVAREEFDTALDLLHSGAAVQDKLTLFAPVGLELLVGLIHAARGESAAARDAWARELARDGSAHIFGRERNANTWYARGALDLREGRRDEAVPAFRQALTYVPDHRLAALGLKAAEGHLLEVGVEAGELEAGASAPSVPLAPDVKVNVPIEVATVHAAAMSLDGRHDEAARLFGAVLQRSAPSQAGWQLPVEPLLHVSAHRDVWADALATLRVRHL